MCEPVCEHEDTDRALSKPTVKEVDIRYLSVSHHRQTGPSLLILMCNGDKAIAWQPGEQPAAVFAGSAEELEGLKPDGQGVSLCNCGQHVDMCKSVGHHLFGFRSVGRPAQPPTGSTKGRGTPKHMRRVKMDFFCKSLSVISFVICVGLNVDKHIEQAVHHPDL